MKKLFVYVITVTLVVFFGSTIYASQPVKEDYKYVNPHIFYKGEAIDFLDQEGKEIKPISYKDTTYLPIRSLANTLGLDVKWHDNIKTVHLMTSDYLEDEGIYENFDDNDKLSIKVNNHFLNTMDSYGNNIEPFILDNVTYVPIRLISESLGFDVEWKGENSTITITEKDIETVPIKAMYKQSFIIDYPKNLRATFYISGGKAFYDIYEEGKASEVIIGEIPTLDNIESLFYFENVKDGELLEQYIYFINNKKEVYLLKLPFVEDYSTFDFFPYIEKVESLNNIIDMYYVDNGVFFVNDIYEFYLYDFEKKIYESVKYSYIPAFPKEVIYEEPIEEIFEDINVTYVGDIYLSDYVLGKYKAKGIGGVVGASLLKNLEEADIFMANQEFAFSNRGKQAEDKQYTFRVNPIHSQMFLDMGIDILTLANNHTLDFGTTALLDTFDTLEDDNIKYVGAGSNINKAKEFKSFEVNDKKIGFLGASRVIPVYGWNATQNGAGMLTTYDSTLLVDEIQKAKEECDFVSTYVHWGVELATEPEEYQRSLAKEYIDAGADIVIGSHPHVLQGIEFYEGKPIVYSLGNFIFYNAIKQTAVLNTTIDENNNCTIQILPCKAVDGQTYLIEDTKIKNEFYRYIESISYGIEIDDEGYVSEKK